MDDRGHLDLLAFQARKVYRDHRAYVGLQDQWARRVNPVRSALVVNEVTGALVANLGLLDLMVLLAKKDSAVKLANVAQWAPRVAQDPKDRQVLQGNLVIQVQMVNRGQVDHVDHQANAEHPDKWDP